MPGLGRCYIYFLPTSYLLCEAEHRSVSLQKRPILEILSLKWNPSCVFVPSPRMRKKSPVGRTRKRKYFWIPTAKRFPRRTPSRSLSAYHSVFSLVKMRVPRIVLYGFSFRELCLRKEGDQVHGHVPLETLPSEVTPCFWSSAFPPSSMASALTQECP